jgi:hypothetical protein
MTNSKDNSMNRILLSVCIMVCVSIVSCKKELPYSIWIVNGEGFNTNKVAEAKGKGGSGLQSDDQENGFTMVWGLYGIPGPGVHYISLEQSNNPGLLRVSFGYKGTFYVLSPNNSDSLIATVVNNKMHYEMPAAWFKNYNNPMDSVLISATLIQP